MSSVKMRVKIVRQDNIAPDIFSMEVKAPEIAQYAKAGQFVSLFSEDGAKLLPRPISICEINTNRDILRLVYRVAGAGTKEFSQLVAGDTINIMGPIGNGFTLKGKKAILIGGGIGIPPMLQLAKELNCEKSVVLGFRDDIFLVEEFETKAHVYIASEDGQHGVKGNVMDAIKEYGVEGDIIYACGPTPMLKAIQAYAIGHKIEAQLSMEERMACGVGACLGCVCKSKEIDHHANAHTKRVCKDGPVFDAREVEF